MNEIKGIAASAGIAIGPIFQFKRKDLQVTPYAIADPAAEWLRFQEAVSEARGQLGALQARALAETGPEDAEIFAAHAMMLDDPELHSAVRGQIEQERINAEAALHQAAERIAALLETLDDAYLSARAIDVRDVAGRVLRILLCAEDAPAKDLNEPSIIVARDLTPSDTITLDKAFVLGFCTAEGGATSHTAILARSLGLPAIVGAGEEILGIANCSRMALDGGEGVLVLDPDAETTADFQRRRQALDGITARAQAQAMEAAVTTDGVRVEVVANIGSVSDVQNALLAGAEGVGLLRSEFLYLERDHLPDEEEQYHAYRAIAQEFGRRPVILRTLDVGGDKELPYLNLPPENNPFLGLRAIRLCLARPEIFRPQLRAALRAGAGNNLKLMFPMIATVDEVRQARALLEQCREELVAEGYAVAEMEIGVMVEIPSTAMMADQLAQVVDFFSIGTNDLAQYTMAADRTNSAVAPLASGFEPAVLRLIKRVIEAAHDQGKWVGLCGELAGEPLAIPLLLGLGLDEFSMNSPAIPVAKQIIRSLSTARAREIAEAALGLENAAQVKAYVQEQLPVREQSFAGEELLAMESA